MNNADKLFLLIFGVLFLFVLHAVFASVQDFSFKRLFSYLIRADEKRKLACGRFAARRGHDPAVKFVVLGARFFDRFVRGHRFRP